MYTYKFEFVRAVDGDTVDVLIDLGFDTFTKQRVRLADIDAPEIRGKSDDIEAVGWQATRWLADRLSHAEAMWLTSEGKGKYGRYLVTLYDPDGQSINQQMIDLGLAWEYGSSGDLEELKRKQQSCGGF